MNVPLRIAANIVDRCRQFSVLTSRQGTIRYGLTYVSNVQHHRRSGKGPDPHRRERVFHDGGRGVLRRGARTRARGIAMCAASAPDLCGCLRHAHPVPGRGDGILEDRERSAAPIPPDRDGRRSFAGARSGEEDQQAGKRPHRVFPRQRCCRGLAVLRCACRHRSNGLPGSTSASVTRFERRTNGFAYPTPDAIHVETHYALRRISPRILPARASDRPDVSRCPGDRSTIAARTAFRYRHAPASPTSGARGCTAPSAG